MKKYLTTLLLAALACIAAKANNFTAGWTEEIFQGGNMEVENGDPADEVIRYLIYNSRNLQGLLNLICNAFQ